VTARVLSKLNRELKKERPPRTWHWSWRPIVERTYRVCGGFCVGSGEQDLQQKGRAEVTLPFLSF